MRQLILRSPARTLPTGVRCDQRSIFQNHNLQSLSHPNRVNWILRGFSTCEFPNIEKKIKDVKSLLENNKELKQASSYLSLTQCILNIPFKKAIDIDYLRERTESHKPDDVTCVYNLNGIGHWDNEKLTVHVSFLTRKKANGLCTHPISSPTLMNIVTEFHEKAEKGDYKSVVLGILEKEKKNYLRTVSDFTQTLDINYKNFMKDLYLQKLVYAYGFKNIGKLFPEYNFKLLYEKDQAEMIEMMNSYIEGQYFLVDDIKNEKRTFDKSQSTVLAIYNNLLMKSSICDEQVFYKLLNDLKILYNTNWLDFVISVWVDRGFFINNLSFNDGLRLRKECVCLHFLDKESSLKDEQVRANVLSKCMEYGWNDLAKEIKEKFLV